MCESACGCVALLHHMQLSLLTHRPAASSLTEHCCRVCGCLACYLCLYLFNSLLYRLRVLLCCEPCGFPIGWCSVPLNVPWSVVTFEHVGSSHNNHMHGVPAFFFELHCSLFYHTGSLRPSRSLCLCIHQPADCVRPHADYSVDLCSMVCDEATLVHFLSCNCLSFLQQSPVETAVSYQSRCG